jgi:hypothetical protein
MASNYPTALDSFPTNRVDGQTIEPETDNDQADALNKIEAELGTNPSGNFNSVRERLDVDVIVKVQSGKGFISHGTTAGAARPSGYASVEWLGSVQPTNMANNDTWIDTSA